MKPMKKITQWMVISLWIVLGMSLANVVSLSLFLAWVTDDQSLRSFHEFRLATFLITSLVTAHFIFTLASMAIAIPWSYRAIRNPRLAGITDLRYEAVTFFFHSSCQSSTFSFPTGFFARLGRRLRFSRAPLRSRIGEMSSRQRICSVGGFCSSFRD
jgi:hypothetical protein